MKKKMENRLLIQILINKMFELKIQRIGESEI